MGLGIDEGISARGCGARWVSSRAEKRGADDGEDDEEDEGDEEDDLMCVCGLV